jgi:hypothetical protein
MIEFQMGIAIGHALKGENKPRKVWCEKIIHPF